MGAPTSLAPLVILMFYTFKIFGGQIGSRPTLFGLFYFILVPVFQVVRFPNDACEISGGSYNGTCYTALVFLN